MEDSVGQAVAAGSTGGADGATIIDPARVAFTNATIIAYLVAAGLMAVGSLAYWRMRRGRLTASHLDEAAEAAPQGAALAATVPCSR